MPFFKTKFLVIFFPLFIGTTCAVAESEFQWSIYCVDSCESIEGFCWICFKVRKVNWETWIWRVRRCPYIGPHYCNTQPSKRKLVCRNQRANHEQRLSVSYRLLQSHLSCPLSSGSVKEIRAAVLSDSFLTHLFRLKLDHKILAHVCLKERSFRYLHVVWCTV